MPTLSCGDLELHFEDEGEGPVIVWIPGTGVRASSWHHQFEHFRARYRCLAPDLRGTDGAVGPDNGFTIVDLAHDVVAWLDQLGVTNATVAGISLGSAIAQEVALRRPDLVERLILVSTWSSSAREAHIRRHLESRLYALEHGPPDVYAEFGFWMSSPWLYDHEPDLQKYVEGQLQTHMSSNLTGTAHQFRADLTHETRDRLEVIACPTLVVYGEDDLITLPWYNQTVAEQLPRVELVSVPRAGHLMWLERPQPLAGIVERFLNSST